MKEKTKESSPALQPQRAKSSSAGENKNKVAQKKTSRSRVGSTAKQQMNIRDVRVSVKRLTGTKTVESGRRSQPLKNFKASPGGKAVQGVKRKMVSESRPNNKLMKPKSSDSLRKVQRPIKQALPARNTIRKEVKTMANVNKDIMNKLLKFGAKVAEAVAVSNESVFSLKTDDSVRENLIRTLKEDQEEDFNNVEVNKIIRLIEEEEEQRRAFRKQILESMKVSHETNMAIYTQMLKVLQSVTSSA